MDVRSICETLASIRHWEKPDDLTIRASEAFAEIARPADPVAFPVIASVEEEEGKAVVAATVNKRREKRKSAARVHFPDASSGARRHTTKDRSPSGTRSPHRGRSPARRQTTSPVPLPRRLPALTHAATSSGHAFPMQSTQSAPSDFGNSTDLQQRGASLQKSRAAQTELSDSSASKTEHLSAPLLQEPKTEQMRSKSPQAGASLVMGLTKTEPIQTQAAFSSIADPGAATTSSMGLATRTPRRASYDGGGESGSPAPPNGKRQSRLALMARSCLQRHQYKSRTLDM